MEDNKLIGQNGDAINGASVMYADTKLINSSRLTMDAGAKIKSSDDDGDEPPDGGTRAWLVMIGSFVCVGLIFGVINTYSVTYVHIQQKLVDSGESEASSKAG